MNLELVKERNIHHEVAVCCGQFYLEAQIIFGKTFWYVTGKKTKAKLS